MTLSPIEQILPPEDADLRAVIRFLADVALRLSPEGVVINAYAREDHPATSLMDTWTKGEFRETLTPESRTKFDRALSRVVSDRAGLVEIEINHSVGEAFGLPVRYGLRREEASGSILMIGRDRQDVAATQQRLIAAQIDTEKAGQRSRHMGQTLVAVLDSVPEPVFVVNENTGFVEDANRQADRLLRREAGDRTFALEQGGRLDGARFILASDETDARRAETVRFRRGADRLAVVMLPEDGEGESHAPAAGDAFDDASVAIAVTDADGRLLSTNAAFGRMGPAGASSTRGATVANLLVRGVIDLHAVRTAISREGVVAAYQTMLTLGDAPVPVRLTAFRLGGGDAAQIMWIFRADSAPDIDSADSARLSAMVGRMPLTEIVDEATLDIERRCVEEALRRTGDNRAAAAALLGLSRQSLYVRLRRFGIESKA